MNIPLNKFLYVHFVWEEIKNTKTKVEKSEQ